MESNNWRNIFGFNKLKEINILFKNFYINNSFRQSFLRKCIPLTLIISIFGSKVLLNKLIENKSFYESSHCFFQKRKYLNYYYIKSIQFIQFWSKFGLRRNELLFEEQNEKFVSKKFNFIADITEKVSSAVVFISVIEWHPFFHSNISVSSGSGFVVNSSGLILTNAHVIGNSSEVLVKLFDGRVVSGRVQYVDHRLDLATVQIDVKEKLPFIKLGDSQKSRTGEWVIALGRPHNSSKNTITIGVISSVKCKSRELGIIILNGNEVEYIQTDAALNFGSSGGPLVNLDGEAIGINSIKDFQMIGTSYAIESNYAKEFIDRSNRFQQKSTEDKMKDQKTFENNFICISTQVLTSRDIQEYRFRDKDFPDIKYGILILSIVRGSSAKDEGLKEGDIITHINGRNANCVNQIFNAFEKENSHLLLTVRRQKILLSIVMKPQVPKK